MKTVFPLCYFGSISYFKDIVSHKRIDFEIWDTFPKQTNRNRTSIYTSNGKLDLSIPIRKPNGSKTLTKDIEIDNSQEWQKKHWRAFESAYKHSAYFEHYSSEIFELIFQKNDSLISYNSTIFNRICQWLELPVQWEYTKEFTSPPTTSYYNGETKQNSNNEYIYYQVFAEKHGFISDLSILDALLNQGPLARKIILPNG